MGRYQQLYKNDKKYYCTNSPVIIEASAIEKDTIELKKENEAKLN